MSSPSPLSPEFLKSVSQEPGVYQMLGKREILYVGKALNLRKRLASYVHFAGAAHSKTAVMLSKVQKIETILTTTEKEALILEAALIKKHKPRYNVILRDDKNYPLIKVTTQEKWPRIIVTRQRLKDKNRYFGPYSSTLSMRSTLKLLYSMFPLRRCKTVRENSRPCLNYQLGRCLAPCNKKVSQKTYQEMVQQAIMILEGRNHELLKHLQNKMSNSAGKLQFEEAAIYRDQISGLQKTLERQIIASDHFFDQDIFGLARQDSSVAIAILFVRSGLISGSQTFFINDPIGSDEQILAEAILQYYSTRREPPKELLLPMIPLDDGLLRERLTEIRETTVAFLYPQKGKKKQLLTMAHSNAAQVFSERSKKLKSWIHLGDSIQKALGLVSVPETIECCDISNFGGKQAVGSLVCFLAGEKHTKGYRHYAIRCKDTPDDYKMMEETLERRLQKNKVDTKLPSLLLIDGGKGHLNIAVSIVHKFGLENEIELAAIAKEKKDEGEKLFRPGRKNPIVLPPYNPVLLYLMRVRDEAHRFGITFHRKKRKKNTLRSQLDQLNGVGEQRKNALLKALGSVKRIREATQDELAEIEGIGSNLASSIHKQLNQGANEA